MKTPEQIAEGFLAQNGNVSDSGSELFTLSLGHLTAYNITEDQADLMRDYATAAIKADRAQRPTVSHAEAQELHVIVSGLVRGLQNGREYVTEREAGRALEIAAIIVSDTEA